jgi:hypothetical protein
VIPEVDFEVDELSVVILTEGQRAAGLDPAELQRVLNEHLRFNLRLAQAGQLLTAGAILDAGSGPRFTGLGFSRLPAPEMGELIAEDPSVRAGVETFRIVRYLFPKGGLSFPAAPGGG